MADAEVGDDVYREDPTVKRLEARVAERLGLEDALYVPSGTQGNQAALGVHCPRGTEAVMEEGSHTFHYENGAVAALWGIQPRTVIGRRGLLTAQQIRAALRGNDEHLPRTSLLVLENTHNRGGGTVWPLAQFQEAVAVAREVARRPPRWSAAVQCRGGHEAARLAWARLTRFHDRLFQQGPGGARGFRASGVVPSSPRHAGCASGSGRPAPGRHSRRGLSSRPDHHVERLAEDHANARLLAEDRPAPGSHGRASTGWRPTWSTPTSRSMRRRPWHGSGKQAC
jgi:threonine aldolase